MVIMGGQEKETRVFDNAMTPGQDEDGWVRASRPLLEDPDPAVMESEVFVRAMQPGNSGEFQVTLRQTRWTESDGKDSLPGIVTCEREIKAASGESYTNTVAALEAGRMALIAEDAAQLEQGRQQEIAGLEELFALEWPGDEAA
jgi:hypothetical protein